MNDSDSAIAWAYRLLLGAEPVSPPSGPVDRFDGDDIQTVREVVASPEFARRRRFQALFAPSGSTSVYSAWLPWTNRTRHVRPAIGTAAIGWAYRLLLGQPPPVGREFEALLHLPNELALARTIIASRQFGSSDRLALLFGEHESCDLAVRASDHVFLPFSEIPRGCFASVDARDVDGYVCLPRNHVSMLNRVRVHYMGPNPARQARSVELNLGSVPHLNIHIGWSNQWINIAEGCEGLWTFRMWGPCSVTVGAGSTANGADCLVNSHGTLSIGADCMFADPSIHVGDNHAVFDVGTLQVTNFRARPKVVVESHVWLGARTAILPDSHVGAGCIVGAGTTVKGGVPPCSLFVGNPGRVVKSGVSWTRSQDAQEAGEVAQRLRNLGAI